MNLYGSLVLVFRMGLCADGCVVVVAIAIGTITMIKIKTVSQFLCYDGIVHTFVAYQVSFLTMKSTHLSYNIPGTKPHVCLFV